MLRKDRDGEKGKKERRCSGLSDEGGWEKQLSRRLKKDEDERGSKDKEKYRPLKPDDDCRAAKEGEIDEDDSSDELEEDW